MVAWVIVCRSTPLDDYVYAADPHFAWNILIRYDQPDYTLYILNFTSQKWLDGNRFSLIKREACITQ